MLVRWTHTALRNLNDAIEYIAADRPIAAKEVGQRIWDSTKMLKEHPEIGRPGRVPGTRELIISASPFILPYIEKDGVIFILRVMHTSMKWPKKFS
ncbi:MAG: type II toxin-antitoxin system RelE/ParE family toxin [Desulfobacterium sp.]|jgi:plasmid stabilization system protein ParE|nr:type II toxin-antitoxin system RelE/ParE family toxin [Desulfobacterium sp.]